MCSKAATGAALAALAFAGCGEESQGPVETEESQGPVEISRSTFKGQWPFTVERGVLGCEGTRDLASLTFTANGTTYGINGTALTRGKPRVDPIWKKNPGWKENPAISPRVSIVDVMDRARELCE